VNRPDRIWSYFEGHNARRHPDPLDAIEEDADATVIRLFHEARPPMLDDDAVTRRRAMERVKELIAESGSDQLAPFLRSMRQRLGLTRRDLAADLGAELGVSATSVPKLKRYYADLENELLSARRLAPDLYVALARVLAVDEEELRGAARFSSPLRRAEALAFARAANASSRFVAPAMEKHEWDRVDALFLGGADDQP
jgi:transcriptional regulator with XRE-family HTH domain